MIGGIWSVEPVKVIKTKTFIGAGTEEDPVRPVTQYWNENGKMIRREDPVKKKKCLGGEAADIKPEDEKIRGTWSAQIIEALKMQQNVGDGTEEKPVRTVIQYRDRDGKMIGWEDPLLEIVSWRKNIKNPYTDIFN